MINFSMVKQTIREVYQQPPIILVYLIIAIVILLALFTFNVEYEGDVIVSMKFIGIEIDETQVGYVFIRNICNLFKAAFMFLFILQSSTLFPDTLKNPLLGIILTKHISRTSLFLSKYLGQVIAIFSLLLALSVAIIFILFFKINGSIILMPLYFSLFVFLEFVAIFIIIVLLSLIFEKSLAVTIIGLMIYFILSPLFGQAEKMGITFTSYIAYISYMFPPLWEITNQSNNIIDGETINGSIFAISMLYVTIYSSISIYLFKRRDIA